jgi:hypothetical protein
MKRAAPDFYTPETLARSTAGIACGLPDGRYVACRPERWAGLRLRKRLRAAWLVFTGRADVLQWEGQQ